MKTGATFSDNRKYRYTLTRIWDESKPLVTFCMLNPSTADETTNDPTIERCQRRAEMMGFGGLIVVNLFAYRATDPDELYSSINVCDLSPFQNDDAIIKAAKKSKLFICGWGKHGALYGRGRNVVQMLKKYEIETYALKINKDGSPAHPLYIGYKVEPKPFEVLTKKTKQEKLEEL